VCAGPCFVDLLPRQQMETPRERERSAQFPVMPNAGTLRKGETGNQENPPQSSVARTFRSGADPTRLGFLQCRHGCPPSRFVKVSFDCNRVIVITQITRGTLSIEYLSLMFVRSADTSNNFHHWVFKFKPLQMDGSMNQSSSIKVDVKVLY